MMTEHRFTIDVVRFDKKNENGRQYRKSDFFGMEIYETIQSGQMLVVYDGTVPIDLSKVVGKITTLAEVNGKIRGTFSFIGTPSTNHVASMDPKTLDITPIGVGKLDKDGFVNDYKLLGFSVQPKQPVVKKELTFDRLFKLYS